MFTEARKLVENVLAWTPPKPTTGARKRGLE